MVHQLCGVNVSDTGHINPTFLYSLVRKSRVCEVTLLTEAPIDQGSIKALLK